MVWWCLIAVWSYTVILCNICIHIMHCAILYAIHMLCQPPSLTWWLGCYWLVWSEFYLQTNRFGDGLRSKQNGFCICATLRESGHPKCTNIWMQGYAISGNKNGSNTRIMMQSWTAWADEIQLRLNGFFRQEFQIWWWLKIASSRNTYWLLHPFASYRSYMSKEWHFWYIGYRLLFGVTVCRAPKKKNPIASVTPRLEACSEEDLRERKAMCQWRLGKARTFSPPCISRCKCNIHKHLSVRWSVVACFMHPVFPLSILTFLHGERPHGKNTTLLERWKKQRFSSKNS